MSENIKAVIAARLKSAKKDYDNACHSGNQHVVTVCAAVVYELEVVERAVAAAPLAAITVVRRANDWHASLDATRWECGKTAEEAIGKLIVSHARQLGLEVKFNFKQAE